MNTHTQYLLVPDRTQSILACVGPATDKSGAFTPFGYRRSGKVSAAWNGQVAESLSEHYLLGNGHRAYHPVLGRFSRPDALSPFGQGGLNTYAYCKGDPINATDPSGRISSALLFGVTAVVVGAGGGAAGWLWSEGHEIGATFLLAGSLVLGSVAVGLIMRRSVQRAGVQQLREFGDFLRVDSARLRRQAQAEQIAASQFLDSRSATATLNAQERVAPFHSGAGPDRPPSYRDLFGSAVRIDPALPSYQEALGRSQQILPPHNNSLDFSSSPDQSFAIRRIREY